MDEFLAMATSAEVWTSLVTLSALEIVLGIDNIIFISILTGKLPPEQRDRGRKLGLLGALVTRVMLLCLAAWIVTLEKPLVVLFEGSTWQWSVTGKGLILLVGGLFLLYKATHEIHSKLEGAEAGHGPAQGPAPTFAAVIGSVMLLDMVFSLDSVITAVGMARQLSIMVAANLVALAVMLLASGYIARFVEDHPTIKILALSFLLLIGFSLVAEALGMHIPKGYMYFAMGFSVVVEMINIRVASKARPVELRNVPKTAEG